VAVASLNRTLKIKIGEICYFRTQKFHSAKKFKINTIICPNLLNFTKNWLFTPIFILSVYTGNETIIKGIFAKHPNILIYFLPSPNRRMSEQQGRKTGEKVEIFSK
jgi:hypothetical protein